MKYYARYLFLLNFFLVLIGSTYVIQSDQTLNRIDVQSASTAGDTVAITRGSTKKSCTPNFFFSPVTKRINFQLLTGDNISVTSGSQPLLEYAADGPANIAVVIDSKNGIAAIGVLGPRGDIITELTNTGVQQAGGLAGALAALQAAVVQLQCPGLQQLQQVKLLINIL